jgi:surfeit locus 1 family protein
VERFRSSAIGLALLAAPAAVTLGLGTWQMQRYNWKNGLIAFREQQLRAEPIPMSELHTMSAATPNSEFTRVWPSSLIPSPCGTHGQLAKP